MSLLPLSELPNVLKVQQEVNGDFNFEDANVHLKLLLLKLIYGTSLGEIAKEINHSLLKNVK